MTFDPENPVIKLCAEGMNAEAEGNIIQAKALFSQAWDTASNDFEAFTAAHYMARHQETPEQVLHWNLEALQRAQKVQGMETEGHLPSLYLNAGKSYEALDNIAQARHYYEGAARYSDYLPAGGYGDMIRAGISSALKRTGTDIPGLEKLDMLVNAWCERKDLRPLSFVLPAYVGYIGSENDKARLSSALHYLSAMRCLPEEEQNMLEEIISALAAK